MSRYGFQRVHIRAAVASSPAYPRVESHRACPGRSYPAARTVRRLAAYSMARPEVQWLTVSLARLMATQDRARVQSPAIVRSSIVQFSVHPDSAVHPNAPFVCALRFRSTPLTQKYSSSIVPCGEHSCRVEAAIVGYFCIAQRIIAPSPIKSPMWN